MSRHWVKAWVEPQAIGEPWGWLWRRRLNVVHLCPPDGSGLMPCCGLTPFERMTDRMTTEPALVTCSVSQRVPESEEPA